MKLEGIHHVTCITGNAPGNVDFYTRVLGLRLVKKTVNQDDPTVYHLFYADEEGSPGADITFFEYPGARRGRAGDGMVHTVTYRVASEEALDFWEERLARGGRADGRASRGVSGSRIRRASASSSSSSHVPDEPLVARHPEIPADVALLGFDGVRAFVRHPERSRGLLEGVLGFTPTGTPPGRSGRERGAASTRTTRRPHPGRASPAPGRSTTSRWRRRRTTTRRGSGA